MSLKIRSSYRFDEFELQCLSRVLLRNGKQVPLGSKAFDVLTCLVAKAGEVVTKSELLNAVWPDSFVEEGTLSQHVFSLRKALGDKAQFVVTVQGRGYQFAAPVQELVPETTTGRTEMQPSTASQDLILQHVYERAQVVLQETTPLQHALAGGPTRRARWPWMVAAGVLLAVAGGGAWWWHSRATKPAFEKVLVGNPENSTGDSTFDATLKRALEIDLEQSQYIDVMGDGDVKQTLRMMGKDPNAAQTNETLREVCIRANQQALLVPTVSKVGQEYLLTLEALDCSTGKKLGGAKANVTTRERVFSALDSVSARVRSQLGESARSLENYEVPLAQATTPSLEALKAYSLGLEVGAGPQGNDPTLSLPYYKSAIDLDPQFAMAYGAMAMDYYNLSEYKLATDNLEKAVQYSDHTSAREKLRLQAHYYAVGVGDMLNGIRAYEMWSRLYPREWAPLVNICNMYTQMGQYGPAIEAGQKAMQSEKQYTIMYTVLMRAMMRAGRFAGVQQLAQQAAQKDMMGEGVHGTLMETAFAQGDATGVEREAKWMEDNGNDWFLTDIRAAELATGGSLRAAHTMFDSARRDAARKGLKETVDSITIDEALLEYQLGDMRGSRASLQKLDQPDADDADLTLLRVLLGDAAFGEKYLVRHANDTRATLQAYVKMPRIRATLALLHGKPQEAINALEVARPYELVTYFVPTERAEAYGKLGRWDDAIREYKEILANPGVEPDSGFYPLAHLGLARAYAAQGDAAASRAEYQTLLRYWDHADADLPALLTAKAELARLPK